MHATKDFSNQSQRFNYNVSNESDDLDMATQIYWRPICDNDEALPKQLKYILLEEDMMDNPLTIKDIGFLKGLKAAGIEGAETLIEAIQRFGQIQLYEN